MNLFSLQLSYLLSALAHPKGTKDGLPDSYTMDASSSAKCAISCTNSPRAELGKERSSETGTERIAAELGAFCGDTNKYVCPLLSPCFSWICPELLLIRSSIGLTSTHESDLLVIWAGTYIVISLWEGSMRTKKKALRRLRLAGQIEIENLLGSIEAKPGSSLEFY